MFFMNLYFYIFIFQRTGIKCTSHSPSEVSSRIDEIDIKHPTKTNVAYSHMNYDDWQNWDAGPIRKDADPEFRTIRTMANYEEHSSDWLRFYGEFYCFHGSFKLTKLDQCRWISRHIYIISDLWQSALQQHFSTRLNHKVKLELFLNIFLPFVSFDII